MNVLEKLYKNSFIAVSKATAACSLRPFKELRNLQKTNLTGSSQETIPKIY